MPIWLNIEEIVVPLRFVSAEDDTAIITRNHIHLHFIDEVAEIGILSNAAMEKLLCWLCDIQTMSCEQARGIMAIRSGVPAVIICCQRVIQRQAAAMSIGVRRCTAVAL